MSLTLSSVTPLVLWRQAGNNLRISGFKLLGKFSLCKNLKNATFFKRKSISPSVSSSCMSCHHKHRASPPIALIIVISFLSLVVQRLSAFDSHVQVRTLYIPSMRLFFFADLDVHQLAAKERGSSHAPHRPDWSDWQWEEHHGEAIGWKIQACQQCVFHFCFQHSKLTCVLTRTIYHGQHTGYCYVNKIELPLQQTCIFRKGPSAKPGKQSKR